MVCRTVRATIPDALPPTETDVVRATSTRPVPPDEPDHTNPLRNVPEHSHVPVHRGTEGPAQGGTRVTAVLRRAAHGVARLPFAPCPTHPAIPCRPRSAPSPGPRSAARGRPPSPTAR